MIITVHDRYLPDEASQRVFWLNELNTKLPPYVGAPLTVVTPGDLTQLAADAPFYQYIIGIIKPTQDFSKAIGDFADLLEIAPQGIPFGPTPTLMLGVAPPIVPAGIFTRTSMLVDRIKGDSKYTTDIGRNLRIVGAQFTVDTDTLKPDLKGKIVTGFPLLQSHKHHTDGFNLYCDYGDGRGLVLVKNVSTRGGYHDMTALPTSVNLQIRTYIAVHTISDTEVGQPSLPVSITVTRIA